MTKKVTKEEFPEWFEKRYPLRAKLIGLIARLIVWCVTLSIVFITITAIYALFKWAIGVWV